MGLCTEYSCNCTLAVKMGVSVEQWRSRIGSFEQPIKCKVSLPTLKLKHVLLSVRIALFFMLLSQGIEANPGPPPVGSRTYTRSDGRGRGSGTGRGRGRGGEDQYYLQSQTTARVTRSSSLSQNRQPSINDWLNQAPPSAIPDTRGSRRNRLGNGIAGSNESGRANTNAWFANETSLAMSDTRDNRPSGTRTSGQNTRIQSNTNAFDTSSEHSENDNDNENENSDASVRSTANEGFVPAMGSGI